MDARSVWRSINRQQKREEVAGALSRAHYRLNKRLREDEARRLNEKGVRLLKRASYSLLIDSLDVQRDGTTPIREYLR